MVTTTTGEIRIAVSTVIFTINAPVGQTPRLTMPLVRRTRDPFEGRWALPGGWLRPDESLAEAASRTLHETTSLAPSYLEQLYAFGGVDRSPERVVSVVYTALLRPDEAKAQWTAEDAENVRWVEVPDLPDLAFDHDEIVEYALWRLRNKASYSRIAHGLLPEVFTLAELREAHEAVLGTQLDPANFRRTVEASRSVVATDEFRTGSHRPARLYRNSPDVELAERGPLPESSI